MFELLDTLRFFEDGTLTHIYPLMKVAEIFGKQYSQFTYYTWLIIYIQLECSLSKLLFQRQVVCTFEFLQVAVGVLSAVIQEIARFGLVNQDCFHGVLIHGCPLIRSIFSDSGKKNSHMLNWSEGWS